MFYHCTSVKLIRSSSDLTIMKYRPITSIIYKQVPFYSSVERVKEDTGAPAGEERSDII